MSLDTEGNNEKLMDSPSQWQVTSTSTPQNTADPLVSHQGQPLLGQAKGNKKYLGRIIIELWDDDNPANDAYNITLLADATDGNAGALLQRIVPALTKRSQGKAIF